MRRQAVLVVVLSIVASLPLAIRAQAPATFYEENCSSCHTIGGGAIGGPDLKGVTSRRDREWLIQFMLAPEKFADDPAVKQMIKEADGVEMAATEGMTRELAETLLVLIERRSGTPPETAVPERPVSAADVELGRALFTGQARLSASRAPCVACHAAGDGALRTGGRLGPDLALVHDRLGGHRGLTSWLGAPPTPMMRAVYRRAPLTADEAHAIAAFLAVPLHEPPSPPAGLPLFVTAGTVGALAFVGAIALVWARRFRAVRRPLVEHMRHAATSHASTSGGHR